MSGDPEQLLAEALRAQAGRANSDTSPIGNTFVRSGDRVAEDPTTTVVPVGWLLLLAGLLGLATGAVIGLLTLL